MLVYCSASLSFPPLPSAADLAPPADADADEDAADAESAARERAADAWCAVFAPKPAPTLVFAPAHVAAEPLYALVLHKILGDSSVIVRHARDGKLRLLREGTVSKQTFWDSLLCASLPSLSFPRLSLSLSLSETPLLEALESECCETRD